MSYERLTDKEKRNVQAVNGCTCIIAYALMSAAVGSVIGWPIGVGLFGIVLLSHALIIRRKLNKEP